MPRRDRRLVVLPVLEDDDSDLLDSEFLTEVRYDADAIAILRRTLFRHCLFRRGRPRRALLAGHRLRHSGACAVQEQQQRDDGPSHACPPPSQWMCAEVLQKWLKPESGFISPRRSGSTIAVRCCKNGTATIVRIASPERGWTR